MPSKYISKLSGTFRHGVQRSLVGQETGLLGSAELLVDRAKYLLGYSGFSTPGLFGLISNPHLLLRPRTSNEGQFSVVGAFSHVISAPVSEASFQVCNYSTTRSLAKPILPSLGIGAQEEAMAVSNGKAFLVDPSLTSRCELNQISAYRSCISFSHGSYDGFRKASMSLRNKEQPDNFLVFGYFAYNIHKRRGGSNVCPEFGWKNFEKLSSASFSAGTASDVSFDSSGREEQPASSADSSHEKTVAGRALKLQSGSCYLPHPDKEETGGEDAHFICTDEQAIGVADGVGGWADLGVDAGQYARELMSNSVNAVQEEPKGSIDPARVLEKAYLNTKAKGSSTACIVALTDQRGLHAINLGDSGFMVVRDGCTVFRSPVQQHDFNFTFQLESGNSGDLPSSGQVFSIPVAPGDVVVAGTDGLFDNLYNNDITAVVVHATRAGLGPQVTAQKIAALARQRAQDKNRQTPFSTAAQDAGFRYYGGKLDDITVVVSYITTDNNEKKSSENSLG